MNEKTNERPADSSIIYVILGIVAAILVVVGFLVLSATNRNKIKQMQVNLDDMVTLEETPLLDVL